MCFYPFILVLMALLIWGNVAGVRLLRQRRAAFAWWAALVLVWAAGIGVGIYGGFFFEYRASARVRIFSAPLPVAVAQLEGPPGQESWVHYVPPHPLLPATLNALLVPLLVGLPLGFAFRVWGKRRTEALPTG